MVVGTDDVLPMRRVQDVTGIHDERDYAEQVGGTDAIDDSFATQWFLSDDVYGDPDPIDWLGRQLFLPDAAVGRLVESSDDVDGADRPCSSIERRARPADRVDDRLRLPRRRRDRGATTR